MSKEGLCVRLPQSKEERIPIYQKMVWNGRSPFESQEDFDQLCADDLLERIYEVRVAIRRVPSPFCLRCTSTDWLYYTDRKTGRVRRRCRACNRAGRKNAQA